MSGNTNTIQGRGHFEQYEAEANEVISPGHQIELLSTGKVQKVATAGIECEKIIAVEDAYQGNDISDDYSAGDMVQYRAQKPGNIVYCRLKDGENVAIGAKLAQAGGGEVKAMVADSSGQVTEEKLMYIALEAVNLSSSSGADPSNLIKCRVV